jgi:hypothetical protein
MKFIFMLILLMVAVPAITAQDTQLSTSQVHSDVSALPEIQTMLKETIDAHSVSVKKNGDNLDSQKVDLVKFDGCVMSYRYTVINKSKSESVIDLVQRVKLPLRDIDPSRVKVESSADRYFVQLYTSKGKLSIKLESKMKTKEVQREMSAPTDQATFPFEDAEIAKKVAKAFIRAINLCKER